MSTSHSVKNICSPKVLNQTFLCSFQMQIMGNTKGIRGKLWYCDLESYISIQLSSVAQLCLFATPWTAARQASLSITNSQGLLKLMSIKSVTPSNHLILCHPFYSCLQYFPASVFSSESVLHIRWPKYWSFSFSISPSNEYSGLTSFRIDSLDRFAVQGMLKNLLQTLQKHQFFGAQLSL